MTEELIVVLATGKPSDLFGSTPQSHAQLEALPGAKVTATVESSLDGGQNNIGVNARLPAAATVAQTNALGDSIERTIWLTWTRWAASASPSTVRAAGSRSSRGSTKARSTGGRWVSGTGPDPTDSPADPNLPAAADDGGWGVRVSGFE